MKLAPEAHALLEALSEPAFLCAPDGTVTFANRSAQALIGETPAGQSLSSLHAGDADAFQAYFSRCLGSRQALVGSLTFRTGAGLEKFQCRGSRVSWDDGRAVLLRLSRVDEERFVAVTRKVEELGRELKERQRTEALLEETLREREILLRELQHRVKNNMHMLAAMLIGAERESTSLEAKAALRDASIRFSAVSAVQQLLYSSEGLATISSEELMKTLVAGARSLAPKELHTEVQVDPIELPIDAALPIALMINELLTNAVKYGRPAEGEQKIRLAFLLNKDMIDVVVQDNGPGFNLEERRKRASGIGLVRGLLRQLGGSLKVTSESGSYCTATIPDPRLKRPNRKAA
jgi:two-component sensor histidine kinase